MEGKLTGYIGELEIGEALSHNGLTLVPLGGNGTATLDYILGAEAIRAGTLVVTEVDESGSVPELLVRSTAETMVLLLDGEELVGAKQNRILNTSVLLPPKVEARIPVSCVEQGRWHRMSEEFSPGAYSPSHLRARKSKDVSRNLREQGRAASDQAGVWEEVGEVIRESASPSPTMAMHDVAERRRDSLDGYLDELTHPDGARGVVAAVHGEFAAIDCFDKPDTLRRIWTRLISGYAMDAIRHRGSTHRRFTAGKVNRVFEQLRDVECDPCPSVGIGSDWRFESDAVVGQALVAEAACVHLSVFPNRDGGIRRTHGSRLAPPSRRGRRPR